MSFHHFTLAHRRSVSLLRHPARWGLSLTFPWDPTTQHTVAYCTRQGLKSSCKLSETACGIFHLQIIIQAGRLAIQPLENSLLPPALGQQTNCPECKEPLASFPLRRGECSYPDTLVMLQLCGSLQCPRDSERQRRQSSVPQTSNCVIKQIAPKHQKRHPLWQPSDTICLDSRHWRHLSGIRASHLILQVYLQKSKMIARHCT